MSLPFVRLIATVTESGHLWGDSAFLFYTAFRERGFPIRVVSNGAGYPCVGRWQPHGEDFMRAVPDVYLNVMCLPVSDIGIALTVGIGIKNVAITRWPEAGMQKDEIAIVDSCELVVVPPEDVSRFAEAEIGARAMSPFQVAQVLAGF
jgi:hypothetical protein